MFLQKFPGSLALINAKTNMGKEFPVMFFVYSRSHDDLKLSAYLKPIGGWRKKRYDDPDAEYLRSKLRGKPIPINTVYQSSPQFSDWFNSRAMDHFSDEVTLTFPSPKDMDINSIDFKERVLKFFKQALPYASVNFNWNLDPQETQANIGTLDSFPVGHPIYDLIASIITVVAMGKD